MSMQSSDFDLFQQQIQELYQAGDYQQALATVIERSDDFPDYQHLLNYWRITLAARNGDTAQALTVLEQVLSTDFWYEELLLRKNPALKELQGDDDFEALVAVNQALYEKDRLGLYPLLILRPEGSCKSGGAPCPLLIGLHDNASVAADSLPFWGLAGSAGWLVVAPQSTQAMWKNAYRWDDRSETERQILEQYATIETGYAVDHQRLVIAGHGAGGDAAIWLALGGKLPLRGFIAFGPDGPFLEELSQAADLIVSNPNPDLRGVIIIGEEDENAPMTKIRILVKGLEKLGIDCMVEIVPEAGRDFTPEYNEVLLSALAYLEDT